MSLPLIRSHTRIDFKRCPKKAYWRWLMGLVPKTKSFGALDLGTWVHDAFEHWYVPGLKRNGSLLKHFNRVSNAAIDEAIAAGAPEHQILKATELQFLGQALMRSYVERYGKDSNVDVIGTEIPLEFVITDERGNEIAKHMLKPDMVFRYVPTGFVWLMENKTAASIRTEHLIIDDQARPYGAMAQPALRLAGVIGKGERVAGIMYNYIRKAFPDTRKTDHNGHYLNQDGSVSKRQPPPYFVRHPLHLGDRAKAVTLRRLRSETIEFTEWRQSIIDGQIDPLWIKKTPHHSCPKFCDFFKICRLEEEGADITDMREAEFTRRNPYDYAATTDEATSFELS